MRTELRALLVVACVITTLFCFFQIAGATLQPSPEPVGQGTIPPGTIPPAEIRYFPVVLKCDGLWQEPTLLTLGADVITGTQVYSLESGYHQPVPPEKAGFFYAIRSAHFFGYQIKNRVYRYETTGDAEDGFAYFEAVLDQSYPNTAKYAVAEESIYFDDGASGYMLMRVGRFVASVSSENMLLRPDILRYSLILADRLYGCKYPL